jgi:hypothetical protein
MKRLVLTSAAVATLTFCGGQIIFEQPSGHSGVDGGYFLDDGAVAFAPGAGCKNYDVSQFALHSGLGF